MIFFNINEVREYLLKTGTVYTLRRKRREGRDEAVKGDLKLWTRIATVMVTRILKEEVTSPQQLLPYVEKSGLHNPQKRLLLSAIEWYDRAKQLHKQEPIFLYAVSIIRR